MATFNIQRKEKIIHLWSKTLKDIYPWESVFKQ
jgi:hypothetical protein